MLVSSGEEKDPSFLFSSWEKDIFSKSVILLLFKITGLWEVIERTFETVTAKR